MKRINYSYATKLNGQLIRHAYGFPFYVLCSQSGGQSLVCGPNNTLFGKSSSWQGAQRIASRLNKLWLADKQAGMTEWRIDSKVVSLN